MRYTIPATVMTPELTETINGAFVEIDEDGAQSILDTVKKFALFTGLTDLHIAELHIECRTPITFGLISRCPSDWAIHPTHPKARVQEWPAEEVKLCITKHGDEDMAVRWIALCGDKEVETAVVTRVELLGIMQEVELASRPVSKVLP